MRLLAILLLMLSTTNGAGDGVMDMLSPFIDLDELAQEAALYESGSGSSAVFDDTYPLASVELSAVTKLYRECRTAQSMAMRTWCIGDVNGTRLDDESDNVLCPPGVRTHPCTGRVLDGNKSVEDRLEFLWPWEGIKCDALTEPTTITHIYLPRENLHCQLTGIDLSVMVSLEQLDLSGNQFYGAFPAWLGEMTVLRLLNLQDNQLEGDIPSSFADNDALEMINLSGNRLTATTLRFFDAFHHLQHLDLSSNKMTLALPRALLTSEFLQSINLSHNSFQGELPELPGFPFLTTLDLSSNQLSGKFPAQLSLWGREDPHDPDEISVLEIVDVSNNTFTGPLPEVSNLTRLRRLDVHNNNLDGTLPALPPILREVILPEAFTGNAFSCPLPDALASSDLPCECGNGYSTRRRDAQRTAKFFEGNSSVLIPANEAPELCFPCDEGYFSNTTTQQTCRPCPEGSASVAASKGRADRCDWCAPGTYSNITGSNTCIPCPPGRFADKIGAAKCALCSPGDVARDPGSTSCSPCPVGTFSNHSGAVECIPCLAGTYGSVEGAAECQLCPSDTFQDEPGSASCKACSTGFVAPYPGHLRCFPCPLGSFYRAETKPCEPCSPNTFSNVEASTSCLQCENGTVAKGFGSEGCVAVAAAGWGYESLELDAVAVKCKPGSFNDGEWRSCELCPRGTFADTSGSVACSPCSKGSFAATEGAVRCEDAPPGSFVDVVSATRPTMCPPNHVSTDAGSAVCTPCEPPSYSFLGGTLCNFVDEGHVDEDVEWPRLRLQLAGVCQSDLDDEKLVDAVVQTWETVLRGYSTSVMQLHVLPTEALDCSVEVIVAVEMLPKVQNDKTDAAHSAAEAIEGALDELLDDLRESNDVGHGSRPDGHQSIEHVVETASFRKELARCLAQVEKLEKLVTPSLLNVSVMYPPFHSTRAVPCPAGTFFSFNASEDKRECRSCPAGSFAALSGALECVPCPRRTFAAVEGAAQCTACAAGSDAAIGATSCVECAWFTYACGGFWVDVALASVMSALVLWKVYEKLRRLCDGDQVLQQQMESEALLAAVRAHGRTFDGAQYAPMGAISADAMVDSAFGPQ